MAKFGVFNNGADKPYRTVEGDKMSNHEGVVTITVGSGVSLEQVAVFKLSDGQSVQRTEK